MMCNNPFAFRPGPVSFWTTVIYLAVAIPLLYVHESVPPAPKARSLYRGLNLTEAWLDLETITNAYHPFNSHQNDVVRDFIIARSKQILDRIGVAYTEEASVEAAWRDSSLPDYSLDDYVEGAPAAVPESPLVTLFDDRTSNVTWTYDTSASPTAILGQDAWLGQYFEGNNYYVYIRGTDDPEGDWWLSDSDYKKSHSKGGVLVNCHFDSVATAFGATDDGMGCVSLLQLLSYFTSENRQPKNGIVLLFNNAEEDGLLGARAFAYSPLMQFCHTFVNLEGAGAGGRAILFRTTDLETAQAYGGSPHPFGSIVGADAFERGVIKSGTDYSVFTLFGMRGIDVAFYGPRSRYHTDEDDARHTSIDSIWHMLSAGLASTEKLSQTTGTVFHGDRSDGERDLVQNGKMTRGVWFDIFGSAWVVFALRGLFAWSLTLLVATPLVLFVVSYVLVRKDKYYFFARNIGIHSEMDDDPVTLGGWKGFFRFPLAFIIASGLTMASVLLVAKVNPLIIYSSAYAVWAMTISLCYFIFWLLMRGSSVVRPTALQRGYVNLWLFILGWALQVFAAVAEDRLHVGALYWAAFLQSAIFVSFLISLLEFFGLMGKQEFARQLHDAHQARDQAEAEGGANAGPETAGGPEDGDDSAAAAEGDDDDDDEEEVEPTETTPLRAGEQGGRAGAQTTFGGTYRRSVSAGSPNASDRRRYAPYEHEQSWSGRLPTWPWIIQFVILAPVALIIIGNLALVGTSSVRMTGTDGSNLLFPLVLPGLMSIILILPLTPFLHRVTHHVPTFLLLIFVGTFIYNLAAFPFSNNHRFKFYFQQVIDLDEGSNLVTLTGIEEYTRAVIEALPSAKGQKIECRSAVDRDLQECSYDASSLPPDLVEGKQIDELMTVTVPEKSDGVTTSVLVDALDTRTCSVGFSRPIFGFSVEGGRARDARFGAFPAGGLQHLQIWRREWQGPWNLTVQLTEDGKSSVEDDLEHVGVSEATGGEELKLRSVAAVVDQADPLEMTIRCAWSDANQPSTIPALHELMKYMPTWAIPTKKAVGLVDVKKTYKLPA